MTDHDEDAERPAPNALGVLQSDALRRVWLARPSSLPQIELCTLSLRGRAREATFQCRDSYTLLLCEWGDCELSYGVDAHRCLPGVAYVSKPFETPRMSHPDTEELRWRVLHLDPALVEAAFDEASPRTRRENIPGFAVAPTPALSEAMRSLFDDFASEAPGAQQSALTKCTQALMELYATELPAPRALPANVRRARDYLHEHYREDVSLDVLAAATGDLHPRYLVSLFHRHVNLPPHQYILHIRVNRARELLSSGWSASHAASEVGFCDQSQLHRHFVRIVGVTPGAYARACRGG